MSEYPQIILDAERMKYAHTGIYHYCKQLGLALLSQQDQHDASLGLYLPASAYNVFPKKVFKEKQKSLHRFLNPFVNRHRVWHVTNQVTNYFPWNSHQKIVLTIHDLNFLYEEKTSQKKQKYLADIQRKANRADVIVAISNFVKSEIKTHLQVNDSKVKVIYNGCNIPEHRESIPPSFQPDFPFIFTLGAITGKKNFAVLPAALVDNDLHLVIAGVIQSKEYFQEIFAAARKHGVADKVHYIGPVLDAHKHWLLEKCSLFAFPSLAEGFGLPVIEAMRFGKPVVLSKATSLPEIGGEAAYYLDSFEASHVRQVTMNAIKNFDDVRKLKTVEWSYHFDWQRAASDYWQVYEQLCN